MSLDELKHQVLKVTVDGVPFDVPVLYHYNAYDKKRNSWPTSDLSENIGIRRNVDTLQFTALLPDLEPYSQTNAHLFNDPTHGHKIRVSLIKKQGDWSYYFDNAFKRLYPSGDGPKLQGFRQYEDKVGGRVIKIVYLNNDKPDSNLVLINCDLPNSVVSPGCTVTAPYLDRFHVKYFFGLNYLDRWHEIHRKLTLLLDDFRKSTKAS